MSLCTVCVSTVCVRIVQFITRSLSVSLYPGVSHTSDQCSVVKTLYFLGGVSYITSDNSRGGELSPTPSYNTGGGNLPPIATHSGVGNLPLTATILEEVTYHPQRKSGVGNFPLTATILDGEPTTHSYKSGRGNLPHICNFGVNVCCFFSKIYFYR